MKGGCHHSLRMCVYIYGSTTLWLLTMFLWSKTSERLLFGSLSGPLS